MSSRRIRVVAALVASAMVLVACGQHPGVHVERGPLGAAGLGPDGEGVLAGPGVELDEFLDVELDGSGEPVVVGPGSEVAADPGAGAGGDAGGSGASTGGTGSDASDGTAPGSGGSQGERQVRGSDRTGVTDDTITIGIHAPTTGAAPLPNQTFLNARDLYWRWITEEKGEKVLGRSKVEVLFEDDQFDPSAAVPVCRRMAARSFLLVGGGGTDQVQACGRFAGQARVPYFSSGVFKTGLDDNPWYFATTLTYVEQVPLLMQYLRRHHAGKKVAAVVMESRNLDEAVAEADRHLQGIDYYGTLRHPRRDTSWHNTFVRQLGQAGVEVVFIGTNPLDYIRFAQTARDQGYDFEYVGVGVTVGLNAVLRSGCPSVGKGTFFSPVPSLDRIDELDPDFRAAGRRFGVEVDDLALALWGLAKVKHELFKRYEATYGTDLTREDFRELTASAGAIDTNVFPRVSFAPNDHFGGTGVHVLKADCAAGIHRDGGTFKSSF